MSYVVRAARPGDLDALARFEADIARVSFGDDAVVDLDVHRKKLTRAMEKDPRGMFAADAADRVAGWLWVSLNTNFVTGDRYANFRSLAIDEADRGSELPELLLDAGLRFACDEGATEVTGRVHVGNEAMRTIYRKFGFEASYLVLRRKCPPRADAP
jgi:ribosomal protein S18 acetylase RimI-like enzyme